MEIYQEENECKIKSYAKARLSLSAIEQDSFKLAPQIPLEIILQVAIEGGDVSITDLFERIPASSAAIRQHIRALEVANMLSTVIGQDRRSRKIRISQHGIEKLNYLGSMICKSD